MNKNDSLTPTDIAAKALIEHGYLFRSRCLSEVKQFSETQGPLGWFLVGEEYPVSVEDTETVIDFVLGCSAIRDFEFVFECKRAHPDFVQWFFADTLSFRRDTYFRAIGVVSEEIKPHNMDPGAAPKVEVKRHTRLIGDLRIRVNGVQMNTDVGLEVDSSKHSKRMKRISQTNTILEACNQVLTGVAGLVDEFQQGAERRKKPGYRVYIPIVVTSARLFLATFDTKDIDLRTGTIAVNDLSTTEFPWVHFDYPVRSSLPLQPVLPDHYGMPAWAIKDDFKVKTVIIANSTMLIPLLKHLR